MQRPNAMRGVFPRRAGFIATVGLIAIIFALPEPSLGQGSQFARPNSTLAAGSWTPAPQHDQIDETVPDDLDFVQVVGAAGTLQVGLSTLGSQAPGSTHRISFRLGAAAGNSGAQERIEMQLFEGAVLRATTGVVAAPRGSWSTSTYTLSAAEAAAITDYSNLRLHFLPTAAAGETVMVSWAALEVVEPFSSLPSASGPNIRSIGSNTGILYSTGVASVTAGTNVVDFSGGASLPVPTAVPAIGPGDRLTLDPQNANERLYIVGRESATRVIVQGTAAQTHTNVPYTITRAYNTIGAWLALRSAGGRGGDLVAEDRREVGMTYKDGIFNENVLFDNSVTDSIRYRHLTVAPGQRHDGTAGTGVVLEPIVAGDAILVDEPVVRVSWLEIRNWFGDAAHGIDNIGNSLENVFEYLLVHDGFDAIVDDEANGIEIDPDTSTYTIVVRNSIFYNIGRAGIHMGQPAGNWTINAIVQNVTIHGNGSPTAPAGEGIGLSLCKSGGGVINIVATNVISVGNSGADFGLDPNCANTSWGTSDFNISSNGTAPGPLVSSEVTDGTGNTGTTVVASGANFVADGVVPGDWFNNIFDATTSRIVTVAPTTLTLQDTGVTANGVAFEIRNSGLWVNAANEFVALGSDYHLKTGAGAIDSGTDLSATFCCDIDQATRFAGAAWDIGADEFNAATAVELTSFTANGLDGAVSLEWETGSELSNLGFHLYRSMERDGPYARITESLIPGLGSSPEGARYRYRDEGLQNGYLYYYQLEDIETTGRTERHGPAVARPEPQSGVPTPVPEGAEEPGASEALIIYGEPTANDLKVSKRGGQIVLELSTGGFYGEPLDDGTVRLAAPGLEEEPIRGSFGIPLKKTWVEAVAGRGVELASVRAFDVVAVTGFRPALAAEAELELSPRGTIRLRETRAMRKEASEPGAIYPADWADVASVGYQGTTKKALVELAPLRWDPASGRLLLSRRLVVRLVVTGREETRRPRRRDGRSLLAQLKTVEKGLHGVRFEDVFGTGRGLETASLTLGRQGAAVPFHVTPDPNRFAPGSWLYFESEGEAANPYGREAVYELALQKGGERMTLANASPSGQPVAYYLEHTEREETRLYQATLLDAPDVFLWDLLFAPETKRYRFETSDLASSAASETATLSVWLQGATDFPGPLDHHIRVSVNGYLANEVAWNGKRPQRVEAELPSGILREGENWLEIENVGDTSANYSMVMLDRFSLVYAREATAKDGRLQGTWSRSGRADVTGVVREPIVLDTTDPSVEWLGGLEYRDGTGTGTVSFHAEEGHRYLVTSQERLHRPEVRRPPPAWLVDTRHHADYLVIGPDELLTAAASLLDWRRSQGLRVMAATTEAIYTEFGHGEASPIAVRDFIAYAYHQWQTPPRYVVLLGDGTYDFKGSLGTGTENLVPPLLVETSYLWTASDPAYASVNGDDVLPDVAIGRLPAANAAEASRIARKIIDYEAAELGLDGNVVLVADDPDEAGNFVRDADDIASSFFPARSVKKIYSSDLGAEQTRERIVRAFDDGASLAGYLGHGGIHLWADENLFDVSRVASLSPQPRQPVLLTMNCLNGYFHFPYFDSLAEALLKAEGRGVIAAFSPSGLSLNRPAHELHRALLNELTGREHERLGDAVLAAQAEYARTGLFPELLQIYHLFGDPALMLH